MNMPVIHPRISSDEPAKLVIREMLRLLGKRRRREIPRRVFLGKWSLLRSRLSDTIEYVRFHQTVVERSRGICEGCGAQTAVQVHHEIPVALDPRMAVDPDNGRHLCLDCHSRKHPQLELVR